MPDPLAYFGTACGDVIVTDAAIGQLASIRRWVLLWIILLFFYAGVGGILGTLLLLTAIESRAEPDFPLSPVLIVALANLLFAPLALVSAIHLVRFHAAVRRTVTLRRPEDFESAIRTQRTFWRFAALSALLAPLLFALGVMVTAIALDVWP